MKAGQWVAMIVVFVVGVILGFGMGANPGKLVGLETKVQQLTAENAELKSRLVAAPAPVAQPSAATPAAVGK